jgi:hypothetical protein
VKRTPCPSGKPRKAAEAIAAWREQVLLECLAAIPVGQSLRVSELAAAVGVARDGLRHLLKGDPRFRLFLDYLARHDKLRVERTTP